MARVGKIVLWFLTAALSLAVGVVALVLSTAPFRHAPYKAARMAVCHILRIAEAKEFVRPHQRIAWAKVATDDDDDAAYYQSDCAKTPVEFYIAQRRANGDDDLLDCSRNKDQDAALAACSRFLSDHGASKAAPTAYFYRAIIYLAKEDFHRSIADNNKVVELAPNDSWFAQRMAGIYSDRGIAYALTDQSNLAIADLNKSLDLNSQKAFTYLRRGVAYSRVKDHQRAIADYTMAFELEPKNAKAIEFRGGAYEHMKDFDRAIADYTKAIEIAPEHAGTYRSRGDAYKEKGDRERAMADYTKCLSLDSSEYLAYANRAAEYEEAGDRAKARADYEAILKLSGVPQEIRDMAQRSLAGL